MFCDDAAAASRGLLNGSKQKQTKWVRAKCSEPNLVLPARRPPIRSDSARVADSPDAHRSSGLPAAERIGGEGRALELERGRVETAAIFRDELQPRLARGHG